MNLKIYNSSLLLMGLILGLIFFTSNIVGFDLSFLPGDFGDTRLNIYFFEHAHKFFTGKISSYWDAPFMYPEKNVIAFSDNLLGSAPIYSLFRVFGYDIYTSFQLWYIVVTILNYIAAYYFLKYITRNSYTAVLGAMIFAFSLALQSQIAHAQTFPRFAIPLAFLMGYKFAENLNPKYFFLTVLFVVYQIYCGIYLGFMLAIPIGIYIFLTCKKEHVFFKKIIKDKKWSLQILASTIINIILLIPLMMPYMERKKNPNFDHFSKISHSIPTPLSHFFSIKGSVFWDSLSEIGIHYTAWWDHMIFAGGIATICLTFVFINLIIKIVKTKLKLNLFSNIDLLMIAGFITFILYIRIDIITPYIFLYFLPGFSSMRSMTRIINIELIFFALATSYILFKTFRYQKYINFLVFIILVSVIVLDNYFFEDNVYRYTKKEAIERIDNIDSIFSNIPRSSLVSFEPIERDSETYRQQIDAMLASQKNDLYCINAYTATCPGDYSEYWENMDSTSRNIWLAGKFIDFDSLYVIQNNASLKKVSIKDIQSIFSDADLKKRKIESKINYIKTDEKWMNDIRKKAKEKSISIDSMLILDAMWAIEH